jgi:hypothetical protein
MEVENKKREVAGHCRKKVGRGTAAGIASGRLSSFTNTSTLLSSM